MSSFVTIERHLINQQNRYDEISPDMTQILYDVSVASKMIRRKVTVAGFQHEGDSGKVNVHGERVATLDVFANECLKEILSAHGRFSYLGSEEEDEVITVDTPNKGNYAIFFDPLDGSSNIDVNVSVGTIFSVYKTDESWKSSKVKSGIQQIAAGYVIYGSSVMLVYTVGHGVFGFTYDPSIGEFLLSHDRIQIPDVPLYYSMNESLVPRLDAGMQTRWAEFKQRNQDTMSSRYVGSLVADFHRNLLKGGVFAYPGTTEKPGGKLRLMYEANPLAFICEQAGGAADSGDGRILSIKPRTVHDKTPLFIGNKALVDQLVRNN